MEFFGLCKGMIDSEFPSVTIAEMYEDRFSKFYDTFASTKEDLPLFKNLADIYGKKVLDLGCGTGRVSIPLLQHGCDVTAVDLSSDMLDILLDKIKGKNYPLKVVKGDVCDVLFEDRFDVAILPVGTIVLIPDKNKLFKNVYENLRPGGAFVFSFFDYSRIKYDKTLEPHIFFSKEEKTFCIMTEKINLEKRVANMNIFLEDVLPSGEVKHYITSTEKNIISKQQINQLIDKYKFKEIKSYAFAVGDYDMVYELLIKI